MELNEGGARTVDDTLNRERMFVSMLLKYAATRDAEEEMATFWLLER
jgi:hypothetical protein